MSGTILFILAVQITSLGISNGKEWFSLSFIAAGNWILFWLFKASNQVPVLPPCGAQQAPPDHSCKGQTPRCCKLYYWKSHQYDRKNRAQDLSFMNPGLGEVCTIRNLICSIGWLFEYLVFDAKWAEYIKPDYGNLSGVFKEQTFKSSSFYHVVFLTAVIHLSLKYCRYEVKHKN